MNIQKETPMEIIGQTIILTPDETLFTRKNGMYVEDHKTRLLTALDQNFNILPFGCNVSDVMFFEKGYGVKKHEKWSGYQYDGTPLTHAQGVDEVKIFDNGSYAVKKGKKWNGYHIDGTSIAHAEDVFDIYVSLNGSYQVQQKPGLWSGYDCNDCPLKEAADVPILFIGDKGQYVVRKQGMTPLGVLWKGYNADGTPLPEAISWCGIQVFENGCYAVREGDVKWTGYTPQGEKLNGADGVQFLSIQKDGRYVVEKNGTYRAFDAEGNEYSGLEKAIDFEFLQNGHRVLYRKSDYEFEQQGFKSDGTPLKNKGLSVIYDNGFYECDTGGWSIYDPEDRLMLKDCIFVGESGNLVNKHLGDKYSCAYEIIFNPQKIEAHVHDLVNYLNTPDCADKLDHQVIQLAISTLKECQESLNNYSKMKQMPPVEKVDSQQNGAFKRAALAVRDLFRGA